MTEPSTSFDYLQFDYVQFDYLQFDYVHDGVDFEGVIVSVARANAPTVLVFHGMEARSDAQVESAIAWPRWGTGRWPSTSSGATSPAAGPKHARTRWVPSSTIE